MRLDPRPVSTFAGRLAAVALALLAAGCSTAAEPKTCTEIGCTSGLTIKLDAAPAGPIRVELLAGGENGARYVVDCPTVQGCAGGAWFPGFTGDYAVVRATTSEGAFNWEVRPTYSVVQPNGPDCPPTCRTATVTLSFGQ